jgi:trk system potassium uptake protein TrkH
VSSRAAAAPRARRVRIRAVDVRAALNVVGTLTKFLGVAPLVPAAVAIGYGEPFWPFLVAAAATSGAGWALERATAGGGRVTGREAFLVIALTWLVAAGFGAIPYLLSSEAQLDRPVDALFEAMSGFSTTGATILVDVEALDRSLLLWRALTQWIGGMGIIVLALAVLPRLRVGGRQLLEQEMPGPEVEPLTVRIRAIAQRLWGLYVALTAAEVLVLAVLGWTGIDERMDLFRAVAQSLTTIPTGGFSTEARSIAAFAAATQWVIVVFMVAAGTNYALAFRAFLRRDARVFPRDEEFRLYVALLALAAAVLTVELWTEDIETGEAAVRHGVFQVTSMLTTTGFASTDFDTWSTLGLMLLVGLLFIGASAGSASGSMKVVRHLLLGKVLRRELQQTLHPELVVPVRLNGAVVDERALRAVTSFILLYTGIFVVGAVLIAVDAARTGLELAPLDAIAAAATTLATAGPGLGLAGPMGSFEPYGDPAKLVMVGLMWIGRLEVIPIVLLFTRHYWRN